MDAGQIRDKFNLSNDQFYEVAKDGGRHRVRQTFGQLVVEHAYPAQKLQLPFVSSKMKTLAPSQLCHSTRPAYPSKRLGLSIGPLSNFLPISNCDFQKCVPPRKRRTKLDENSAKVATLAKACAKQAISVSETHPISFFGNIPYVLLFMISFNATDEGGNRKNILPLFQILVWEAFLSTIIARKTKKTNIFRR
jgi:hypothetical protein